MSKAQDYTKAFADVLEAFPTDAAAIQDAIKNSAVLGERLSKVALSAAEQSAELSSAWTKDTLNKLGEATKAKQDPADYAKVATDLASASIETASENLAAFAEIAKRVQLDTIELLLAASQDATRDVSKATTKAVKKVAK